MSMMIGHKGVKYGLTIPKQKLQQKQAPKVSHNIFAQQDSDDDQDNSVGHQVARQAATKQSDAKVAQVHQAALEEDPSIFDYDSHVDTIHQQRTAPKQEEKLARKSRYIQGLLDKSKEREREQDIIYERRLLKEREVEDHLFGDKDKFVTAAYKKKLEEDQKWLAEQAVKDKQDEQDDVRKRGHMMDFHRNHFRNVALGGPPPSSSTPAAAAAAASGPAAASDAAQAGPSERQATGAAQPADASWEAARAARERFERAQQSAQQSGAAEPSQEPSQQQHGTLAADSRHAGGTSGKQEPAAASVNGSTWHDSSGRPSHAAVAGASAAAADERRPPDAAVGSDTGQADGRAEGETDIQPAGGAKRTTEDAAAAARERYLARKRKAS